MLDIGCDRKENKLKAKQNTSQKPLCILQVLPALNAGGVERVVIETALFLKGQGHKPLVVSSGGSGALYLRKHGVPHIFLGMHKKSPWGIFRNINCLLKIIKNNRVDVVHVHSRAPAWSAYFACKRAKVPLITTFHGAYKAANFFKRKYNAVMTYGQKVLAPSKFIKTFIQKNYGSYIKGQPRVLYQGVNLQTFDAGLVDQGRLMRLLKDNNLPFDKKIILLPGRFTRLKGHLSLLEAISKLMHRDDFICVLLGMQHPNNAGYIKEVQNFIKKHDLDSRVFMLHESDDMPAFYKLAHVVVSASTKPESFGMTLAEAGAVGCPVIAAAHGGALEIVKNGTTGWLFEPGNAVELGDLLAKALDLPQRSYQKIGRQAIEHIKKNFDNKRALEQLVAIYRGSLK